MRIFIGKSVVLHSVRDLIEDKLLIGQRGGKKPCTQLDSNPLPLCHEACALPLFYHHSPKLRFITASFFCDPKFYASHSQLLRVKNVLLRRNLEYTNRILMQPHPFLRFSARASSEANGINGLIRKWMYETIEEKVCHDKKLSCPFS